ncbi:MAG: hypothetical protein ACRCST_08350 [Turicibacter sp.]
MKDIIRVERKRILNFRNFLIMVAGILIFSIVSSIGSLNNYNVYDSEGNIIVAARDNLNESKLDKHKIVLDEQALKDVVQRKDTSKYLYNSNLVTLVAANYDKKVTDLTEEDLGNFYNQRLLNLEENIGGTAMVEDIEKLVATGANLKTPLQLGYAEGWKNLNNDLTDFATLFMMVIPFIILPIFAQDPKTKMKQLYVATKHGKKTFVKAKIMAAFEVSTIIYGVSMVIFSLSKLSILGFKGANLPIQGSVNFLFCPYNITYFQQFLLNVMIGFMAVLLMVAITLLFAVIIDQILSGAVFIIFILGIMPMLPNNTFEFNHYFKNFLPYHMTNFNSYYIHPEIYNIQDKIIPTAILVIIVSVIVVALATLATVLIAYKKLEMKLK